MNAQGGFPTIESALCYCLCYQHMHYQSLLQVIAHGGLENFDDPLVIDFGAGPGTVPIALAESYLAREGRPLSLRYVDIEMSSHMRRLAGEYLDDESLFAEVRRHSVEDAGSITGEPHRAAINDLAINAKSIIVALSYVLKQKSVDMEFVRKAADLAVACSERFADVPLYILIQDISGPPFKRYNAFHAELIDRGYIMDRPEFRITQPHCQVNPLGQPTPQGAAKSGNVVARAARLLQLA